jgi:hypothetical protein
MKAFITFTVILLTLESAGRLIWLGKGDWPERTRGQIAADLAAAFTLIAWGIYVLTGDK